MAGFIGLFRRDLRLALRQSGDTGLVLGFFVLAVVLFPLGVGPEPAILQRIGAGIVWVAALLAALLRSTDCSRPITRTAGSTFWYCRACRLSSQCLQNVLRIGLRPGYHSR